MKALVIENKEVKIEDFETPVPPRGEALVKVQMAGICDTDLQLKAGYMNFAGIPGHEFVGKVVECQDSELVGRRVVGEINAPCRECHRCRQNLERHCPHRTVLGILQRSGAHSEYLTLPCKNLHPLPDSLSNREALFTEPLAAACEISQQIHIRPGDKVAVVGDGKLGLLIAQVLDLTGCELRVLGRHSRKLDILRQRGIRTEEVARGEKSHLEDGWADLAVECTGNPTGFASARRLVRPRGTLVLKSTYREKLDLYLAGLIIDEITLVGSRCGPFEPALRLLKEGKIDVESLIDETFPLKEGPRAYQRASEKGVLKVLLKMD